MNGHPIRVMIAGRRRLVRTGLRSLLELAGESIEIVGEAGLDSETAALIADSRPEVIVLAAGGEDESLQDVMAALSAKAARLPIVMVAEEYNEHQLDAALQAGLRGYLLADVGSETLAAAIRSAAAGLIVLDPSAVIGTSRRLKDLASSGQIEPAIEGEPLSDREREVLQLVAEGLPNKLIAGRLKISEHTVKFHISSILAKLGAASRTEAVAIASRRGLLVV